MADQREALLSEAHMKPLHHLIQSWRDAGLDVPNPDPLDGGTKAKAVFLLESPGPKAVGTRFISRDNPDPSAQNMRTALCDAGIERGDSILWNVVPYCVSTSERNKNASAAQIGSAAKYTQAFLDLLPDLRAVVFCGRRAQMAKPHLNISCRTFETFHPGARAYRRPQYRAHFDATFDDVARLISG